MKPERIASLRSAVRQHRHHLHQLSAEEMTEMLDAVEARGRAEKPPQSFTEWLCRVELAAGRAYSAENIAWLRSEGYEKNMTPAAALDALEKAQGL